MIFEKIRPVLVQLRIVWQKILENSVRYGGKSILFCNYSKGYQDYMQVCPPIIYQQLESFDLKPFNSLNCRYYPSDSFELGIPYVFVHSKGSNIEKSIKHLS